MSNRPKTAVISFPYMHKLQRPYDFEEIATLIRLFCRYGVLYQNEAVPKEREKVVVDLISNLRKYVSIQKSYEFQNVLAEDMVTIPKNMEKVILSDEYHVMYEQGEVMIQWETNP